MPYEVHQNGETYEVRNADTGEVKDTHVPPDAKEKADAQVRLLEAIEKNPGWGPADGTGKD